MFTVDLEKKLLKKRRGVTSKEAMILEDLKRKEALDQSKRNVLDSIGISRENSDTARRLKNRLSQIKKFPSERVFHIDEIQDLCCSYGLRFLNANLFNGHVDDKLADKILEFQTKYHERATMDNSFIAAPVKYFKLQERPKDPLFFIKINETHYYLVHKWGDDLSVLRGFFYSFKKTWSRWILTLISIFYSSTFLFLNWINNSGGNSMPVSHICFVSAIGMFFPALGFFFFVPSKFCQASTNHWDESYK